MGHSPTFPAPPATAGPGAAACDLGALSAQRFLDVARAVLPEGYLDGLAQFPGSGYELVQAAAQVAARMSSAIQRTGCGAFTLYAPVGQLAAGEVEFYRASAAAGAFTLKAGTTVRATRSGRGFTVTQDVAFGALDLTKTAFVTAELPGYQWNLPGQYTSPNGDVVAGEIDSIDRLVTSPDYADPSLAVWQLVATSGGVAGSLEGIGSDRGVERGSLEAEQAYRLRVRSLPDVITVDAISRSAAAYLAPWRLGFVLIELWDPIYQTCWDAPSDNAGTPTYQATPPTSPDYDEDLCAYDDERPSPPWRNFWLDDVDARGAFVIVLDLASLEYTGFALDDPGVLPSDFHSVSPPRKRGTPAFDVPSSGLDPHEVFPSALDGEDLVYAQLALGIYKLLQRIKAGGVSATVHRHIPFLIPDQIPPYVG